MTDWSFIVVPLLVLPIVLLFRFLGCGYSGVATGTGPEEPLPPGYRDSIMAETSVIAYWRLVDHTATDPKAKDEKGSRDGEYVTVPGLLDEPSRDPRSEAASGGFLFFPSAAGLITSDSKATPRFFDGGHVLVDKPGLYTQEFTIEAWVAMGTFPRAGYQYMLFSAGGRFRATFQTSPDFHGFQVFLNGEGRWQVHFFTNGVVSEPSMPRPMLKTLASTHVALIVKNEVGGSPVSKFWAIYVDGKLTGTGTVSNYSLPEGAPLFIGIEGNPDLPHNVTGFPMKGKIQEVVLHNKALSQEEIQRHVKMNKRIGG